MLHFFRRIFSKPATFIHSKDKDFLFPGLRRRFTPRNDGNPSVFRHHDGVCEVPRPFPPLNDGNSSIFRHHDGVCEVSRSFAPLSDGNFNVFRHHDGVCEVPRPFPPLNDGNPSVFRHPEERSDVGIQSNYDAGEDSDVLANLTHRRGGGTTKLAAKKNGKKTLFRKQNRGASLLEYVLMFGLIAMIALPVVKYLGTELQGIFSSIDAGFEGVGAADEMSGGSDGSASPGDTDDGSGSTTSSCSYGCHKKGQRAWIDWRCSRHIGGIPKVDVAVGFFIYLGCGVCRALYDGAEVEAACLQHKGHYDSVP